MHYRFLTAPVLAAAMLAGGCNRYEPAPGNGASATNSAADADTVKGVEAEMLKAFQAKDAPGLTSHYASDAVLAIPGRTVKGNDAIGKANADDFKDPAFKLSFANERTDASGDLAYTTGSFDVAYTDPATKKVVNTKGTYVTVFKKQADGSWKAVADVATPTEG